MNIYIDGEFFRRVEDERQRRGMESLLIEELQCAVISRNSRGEVQVDLYTEVPKELKRGGQTSD